MNARSILTAAVLTGAVLAAGGCREEGPPEVREVARNVRVLTLGPTEVTEYFEIAGPVSPVRAADLAAEESGPVVRVGAAKGAAVAQGQAIVEQERDILAAQLASARATLETEQYNIDKMRALFEAHKISRMELLNAETAYERARAQVEVARVRHERAAVKAPFDGVVVDRFVEMGELLAPGQPVARVIDPYTLKLETYLTDGEVQWVAPGDDATVRLGESAATATGEVTFIAPEADRSTGKFTLEIEIPNPELRWRSGVIGRALLPKHSLEGAVAVPRDAVLPGRAGPMVYVVADGRAHQRQVELGPYQGMMVVVERGLAAGDELVVRGHRDLRDGSLVKVTERATAPDGSLPDDPPEVTAAGSATRVGGDTGAAAEGAR